MSDTKPAYVGSVRKGHGINMIVVNVDVMLAKRKMSSGELAARVGLTQANLSILKTNKAKAIRFSTLDALCRALNCQPGDILEFCEDDESPFNRPEYVPEEKK